MKKKPFQEQLSKFSLLGELPKIETGLEEAWENLKKCTEPFEVRDIIKQQQETINRQQAEIENQSQNFKVLVSDHRCLQQSFDNLKGLYQAEKEKVESAKSKSIYFAKELQKAWAEINRVTALAAEWKDAAYTYADNIDKIKSEAIEELLDKIEKQSIPNEDDVYWVELDDIYNLVKEMVGDAE